ncbi:MAG: SDR family oxidoreductase [Lentisphaerae bacterium]|nr:SDR family oxidoreductase [Lentisphaerota bacterium]
MELAESTVLVTGGAVRIGRAIGLAFARAGARVVIHHRASAPAAGALAAEIRAAGGTAFTVAGDLAQPGAAEALLADAVAVAGPVDILVNNAAVFHKHTPDTLDAAALEAEFAVNLFAPLLLMRAFAAQGRPGRIVNLLDRRVAGIDPSCVPYELSKKALAAATRSAALHWAPRITVNAVAPGAVLPPPGEGPDYIRDRAGVIPTGRPPTPEEVADAVVFLARSGSITGQVLFIDGGQHLG